jgi:hypothetical protein
VVDTGFFKVDVIGLSGNLLAFGIQQLILLFHQLALPYQQQSNRLKWVTGGRDIIEIMQYISAAVRVQVPIA